METDIQARLNKISQVIDRTGLSRSTVYREILTEKNPAGRLKVVRIGRAVRVREKDLTDFINALAS
jgi:predicted DNA-binding transcriptional regulator AlpA